MSLFCLNLKIINSIVNLNSKNQKITTFKNEISLLIKREDLLHPYISGNKFRKLKYNLLEAQAGNRTTLCTFGGAFSNHILAVAAAGKEKGFKTIVFARTALEIKSSVGAKPVKMYGLITHSNALINHNIARFFNYLEPKTDWQERNPFK